MTTYDHDYYFIRSNRTNNNRLPFLRADINTQERNHDFQAQPMGSAPLVFENADKEDFRARGWKTDIADILFSGNNFLVRGHLRERLLQYDIPNLHIHPSVYIDDLNEWHEDYWFLTFTKRFDCWDRSNSDFDDEPMEIGDVKLYSVYQYSLNPDLLDATPLENRLLFKMGGTIQGMIVCHKSIADIFRCSEKPGAILQPISEHGN